LPVLHPIEDLPLRGVMQRVDIITPVIVGSYELNNSWNLATVEWLIRWSETRTAQGKSILADGRVAAALCHTQVCLHLFLVN
jgi:hypothetical protein